MKIETWIAERLNTEIATIMLSMRNAAESQRYYNIGALSALLWVQGAGEVARAVCFDQACDVWDKMRTPVVVGN